MKSIFAFLKRRNTFTSNRLFVSDASIKAIAVTSFRLFGFASSSFRYQHFTGLVCRQPFCACGNYSPKLPQPAIPSFCFYNFLPVSVTNCRRTIIFYI